MRCLRCLLYAFVCNLWEQKKPKQHNDIHAIKKLCFVSSIAAVGDSLKEKEITEEDEWLESGTRHGYAITKYGAEMEVWRGSQEGLEVVIVNPGVILGSGFWKEGSGKIFDQIHHGFSFYTKGVTGFIGVKDVVQIMIQLTNSNHKNERYILVAENLSFKDVLFQIAEGLNRKKPTIQIRPFLTEIFWRIGWLFTKLTGKKPALTKNSARSAHHISYYSSAKITRALSFTFTPISKVIQNVCKDYSAT